MSETDKLNVIIPPHHQSAPKEHYADRAIKEAAEEIDRGDFIPDPDPERAQAMRTLDLALYFGDHNPNAAAGLPSAEDLAHTRNLNRIGQHPRVIEALERMKGEEYILHDPVEMAERNAMFHELGEASSAPHRWDGQGRWEGFENEEMRYGQLLSPAQFWAKLTRVIREDRIRLSPHAVRSSPEARSGRVGLYVRNPAWKGAKTAFDANPAMEADKLKERAQYEMAEVRRLRHIGLHSEADKRANLAGEMVQQAINILMQQKVMDAVRPLEFMRVGVLQWPLSTEWMIMEFTEWGTVHFAKYLGWRTALLTMVRCGALTEKEAHKAFPVPSGPAADWYLAQLKEIRDQRSGAETVN